MIFKTNYVSVVYSDRLIIKIYSIMIKRLMILSLLLVSMISKSWAYSFTNGLCEYEVISEDEQTVRFISFVNPYNISSILLIHFAPPSVLCQNRNLYFFS